MKRATIIKLGAIGDLIQAAAAVSQYKDQNPTLAVDWVVGQQLESLLTSMKVADQIIAIDDQAILHGNFFARLKSLMNDLRKIYTKIPDCNQVFIAHSHWQYSIFAIPLLLRNPTLIFGRIWRFFPRLHNFRVSEYFLFLSKKPLSGKQGNLALQTLGSNILCANENFKFKIDPDKKNIVLVPGGSKNMMRDDFLRRWPIENYTQLAAQFIAAGYVVILVGSKDDVWVKPYFSGIQIEDFIGKTSIQDLVDIFSRANLIISHDTGPLHLASMTHTTLIAIFGPTPASAVISEERKSLVVMKANKDVGCAPCYDGVGYSKCNDPICMRSTTVDEIFRKAKMLLAEDCLGAQ